MKINSETSYSLSKFFKVFKILPFAYHVKSFELSMTFLDTI